MCGVVQNVSRPILSCQEISHAPPTTLDITAMRQDQTYQGTESVAAESSDTDRARTWDATEIESAKRYLCRLSDFHYDAIVTRESCTQRGDDRHGSRFLPHKTVASV